AIEKRSIATTTVENLVIEVEEESFSKGAQEREINTSEIGEMILDKLYRLDKVAYIRFASAYKHFENLEEFITEIKNIEQHNKVNI
ncbi:MAG: ATP cone domain-containing protein, partial [Treponema sp.]|nr:ATP cone domain-containing protein [Treponema sp.]